MPHTPMNTVDNPASQAVGLDVINSAKDLFRTNPKYRLSVKMFLCGIL